MQCLDHPENATTGFCRNCGRGVCGECSVDIGGVPHCQKCKDELTSSSAAESSEAQAPPISDPGEQPAAQTPPPPPSRPRITPVYHDPKAPSPLLAGVLGIFPGLGAVYNGQYVKGFIHVIIFGVLMSIADGSGSAEALIMPIVALFFLYMPIEAVRTAQAMRRGEQVDELSGVAGPLLRASSNSPVVGVALILFGVFALLLNLEIFRFEDIRPFWPLILIAFGAYQLFVGLRPSGKGHSSTPGNNSGTAED